MSFPGSNTAFIVALRSFQMNQSTGLSNAILTNDKATIVAAIKEILYLHYSILLRLERHNVAEDFAVPCVQKMHLRIDRLYAALILDSQGLITGPGLAAAVGLVNTPDFLDAERQYLTDMIVEVAPREAALVPGTEPFVISRVLG